MTAKHVELRARQMQHFQGIYFIWSEDLCGSDRSSWLPAGLAPSPPACPPALVPPGLEAYAGGKSALRL